MSASMLAAWFSCVNPRAVTPGVGCSRVKTRANRLAHLGAGSVAAGDVARLANDLIPSGP